MTSIDHCIVELDGVPYPVLPVFGSVSIGITRYFHPPLSTEVFGRLNETPIPNAEPVRIIKRPDAHTYVVKRVPVRDKAP